MSDTSTVTLGVKAHVKGNTQALQAAVTLGTGAYTCKYIKAVTATLGADSFVNGNLDATTMTVAAGAFVTGRMGGTTYTLGAGACYGDIGNGTITRGAGAGKCGTVETTNTYDPNIDMTISTSAIYNCSL